MLQTLGDIPGVASGAGALALLTWLVMRIMGQSSSERKEYQKNLSKLKEEHNEEVKNLTKRHEDQVKDLQEQIDKLEEKLDNLREQFEEERRLRWKAEDAAALYRRQVGAIDGDSDNV